jgi:hypothetical protein
MASLGKATYTDKAGKRYRFVVFPLDTRFRKISGVYLIACRAQGSHGGFRYRILHVGSTNDFSEPLTKYDESQYLRRLGANCICIQSDKSAESRLEKERNLIAAFHPPGND